MRYCQYIIAYDIDNTRLRAKLAQELKALGMVALQKSVMWGYLNGPEEKSAREILARARAASAGNVLFMVRADLRSVAAENCFGVDVDKLELPDDDKIL